MATVMGMAGETANIDHAPLLKRTSYGFFSFPHLKLIDDEIGKLQVVWTAIAVGFCFACVHQRK